MGFDTERQVITLTEDQCWALLDANDLGRLAVSVGDRPDIYPINYVSHGRKLYLRTSQGSKLLELTINRHVALEIDDIAEDQASSVVVHGDARELESDDELAAAQALPLRPRVATFKPVYVEITPTDVSGRTFVFGPEPESELI